MRLLYIDFVILAAAGLVSVTFDAQPLPQALARLSSALGQRLECAEVFRNEPLIARLRNVEPERVLQEIATCFEARWDLRGDRRILVVDPKASEARRATIRRRAQAALAKSLLDEMKVLAEHPTFGRVEMDALKKKAESTKRTPEDDEEALTPAALAIRRIAKAIAPADLLRMASGERDVFAESPNAMQLAFPGAANAALAAFRRERALLDPERPVERVRLYVSREEESFEMAFFAADAQNRIIDGATLSLDSTPDDETAPPARTAAEKPLRLATEATEYLALHVRNAKRDAAFVAWRPRLADPTKDEPTAWFPGGSLLALAEARGLNLLASPPDVSPRLGVVAATLPARFFQWFDGALTTRDGWLLLRPRDLRAHVARADARALFAKVAAQGGLDVDAAADWCARYPEPFPFLSWVGSTLAMLTTRNVAGFDPTELRLWGVLTPGLRAALRQGRSLAVAELPAEAQRTLAERIYWGELEGVENDPTDALPDGIGHGVVSLRTEEQAVVVAWSEGDEPVFSSPVDAERFGFRAAGQERTGNVVAYGRFRLGTRTTYTIETAFPRLGKLDTIKMTETFFDSAAKPVDRLPDVFAKVAEAAKQKALLQADEDAVPAIARPR